MKKIVSFILILVLGVNIVGCSTKKEQASLEDLKVMPQFELKSVNGDKVNNEIFKDKKLTMLNVWSTGCGACIEELPDLQALHTEMKNKGVNIIGIVADGINNEIYALDILRKSGVTFVNIIPNEKFVNDFVGRITVVPVSIFVNSKGEIVGEIVIGSRSKEGYKKIIEEILKNVQ
ncbi:Thiol-disulfide isomerase or thioredoxin [Caloranaerobacter azorensis DSM 13643]|uniref:Thiol-disulfide isomerase or thioredoxin n=1 Tax=Caloranaerobacter azorensis DSM 13643 TaxID=1121264 RepID=A0A1M5T391_9FIRM|nr:TlpA disulfide reductase family protein [Caloranaerobacter azorensis]SHH44823.1 Thiol-disulfide isomerase or thioredoxin [Caloranaerobacter azorensis DSM 13643]